MPVTADVITHKRLVLVKQLYNQALVQAFSQTSTVNRIMAVIGFDLSVETILRTIISALESTYNPKDEKSFPQYWKRANDLLASSQLNNLPDERNINLVHTIRNDAQHRAKYPNESDLNDCRTYIRDFLEKTCMEVWGISFDSISLVDLIQHPHIKVFLTKAEAAFAINDYKETIIASVAALYRTVEIIRKSILGRSTYKTYSLVVEQSGRQLTDPEGYIALERTEEGLLAVALGLNYIDYLRFDKIIAKYGLIVHAYEDGTYRLYDGKIDHATLEDAKWLMTYAIDAVIKIENGIGNIEKPF
jgi:hypothetical protein